MKILISITNSVTNIPQLALSSEPTVDFFVATKCHVDSLIENDRSRRDLSLVFIDQDHEVDNDKSTI